ncbi:MAG: tetratricopeptide repeat protein [Gammaproteobacteria bacterium]|nr:MAG: tetratricopeptide repeat protein [Gammaproteobacteria bacterium]
MDIKALEKLLSEGPDTAMLRLSLANAWLREGDAERAGEHVARAVELDPGYSAAWKLYGKLLADSNCPEKAIDVYQRGIEVARKQGDKQAEKEMRVFLKRVRKDQ